MIVIAVNPAVVVMPDGHTGVLIARVGLRGCIEFGSRRVLAAYLLDELSYYVPPRPPDIAARVMK